MTANADFTVLEKLLSSNKQWSKDVDQAEPGFFEQLSKGQKPQILWIGCSDSRAPESVLCAVPPGEIFVTRNIANQFNPDDDSVNAVLAYAVDAVGVTHVIVAGHTHCGGAIAALGIAQAPSNQPQAGTALRRYLGPLTWLAGAVVRSSKGELSNEVLTNKLIEINVKEQVMNVCNSPTMQNAWKAGKRVYVHGWLFEIERGKLRDLGITYGPGSDGGRRMYKVPDGDSTC